MLKNLASSLFLTERHAEYDDNAPKIKGRVVTTVEKAKEVRPLVERCITIARRSLQHTEAAHEYETDAKRGSEEWRSWRGSDQWRKWNETIAPVVAARRRALQMLGDKQAVQVLFDDIAPRFSDRDGGYTRILKLAYPRLGDAGRQAILELVGTNDRVSKASEKPAFDDDEADTVTEETAAEEEAAADEEAPAEEAEAAAEKKDEDKE